MPRKTERGTSGDRRGSRGRRYGPRAVAAACVALAMCIAGVALAPSATAVSSVGPGVRGTHGHIGATIEPGVGNVYCIDSSLDVSFGRGIVSDTIVSSLPARPGVVNAVDADHDAVRGMNFIASTWGGTGDDVTAAAVGIATMAFVKAGGFGTAASYANRDDVIDLARNMYDQAQGVIAAADDQNARGEVALTIDPSNNYQGSLRVAATVAATGTLTLTNGIFLDSKTDTLTGVQTGVDYAVQGVPPTADGAGYRIRATSVGDFTGGLDLAGPHPGPRLRHGLPAGDRRRRSGGRGLPRTGRGSAGPQYDVPACPHQPDGAGEPRGRAERHAHVRHSTGSERRGQRVAPQHGRRIPGGLVRRHRVRHRRLRSRREPGRPCGCGTRGNRGRARLGTGHGADRHDPGDASAGAIHVRGVLRRARHSAGDPPVSSGRLRLVPRLRHGVRDDDGADDGHAVVEDPLRHDRPRRSRRRHGERGHGGAVADRLCRTADRDRRSRAGTSICRPARRNRPTSCPRAPRSAEP